MAHPVDSTSFFAIVSLLFLFFFFCLWGTIRLIKAKKKSFNHEKKLGLEFDIVGWLSVPAFGGVSL